MKRLFNITLANRWKLVFLLSAILAIIITTGMVERYKLNQIRTDFSSIYSDRLIPATDLFFITDNLYEKRFLMNEFLSRSTSLTCNEMDEPNTSYRKQLQLLDHSVDSLLTEYGKTYLVKEEALYLNELKKDLAEYEKLENQVLSLAHTPSHGAAKKLFEQNGRSEFNEIIQDLHHLAGIQSTVGKQLIMRSNADFASTNLLSYLRFTISMIIGAVILALVKTSKTIDLTHQRFNLN